MRIVIRQLVGARGFSANRVENASVTFRYGTFSMRKGYVRLQVGSQIVDFGRVIPKDSRAPSSAAGVSVPAAEDR
jgi:hypothetical protein